MIETTDYVETSIIPNELENTKLETLNKVESIQDSTAIEISDFDTDSDILKDNQKNENISENLDDSYSEPHTIEIEHANTTNCLALTIQKDHKLIAIKNVFLRSIRMTWKVIISTITLSILKLFS